ncbi:flagellar basal body rod protein FlgB [Rubrivirga sp.]|uniref:flagellar basal body rod protein FlgB n=1 Tax=Rubrivirga sp. TaxID=1885344 RepID=UPI003C70D81F
MTPPNLRILQNAMQAYSWRMQALSSNVANLDTPGYDRLSVRFEETLQRARSGPGAADAVTAEAVEEDRPPLLEDELMEIADTQMRTQLASRALHEHFSRMRTGITGRTM